MTSSRADLRADCTRCVGLCCVAPAFARSADFAIDKPAGVACPHLLGDFRCGIHDRLRPEGFPGCAAYDCFGAGQRVTLRFADADWRRSPEVAAAMFAALDTVRGLHELLWYVEEAVALRPVEPLLGELRQAGAETERLAAQGFHGDVAAHRESVAGLLRRTSEEVRGRAAEPGRDLARRDLSGADLRGADLRDATLRGALLLGADLRAAELTRTDLLGADLRGADLRGADAATSLFLTQQQVGSARGDATTRLPPWLLRPPHWLRAAPKAAPRPAGGPSGGESPRR